jgi:uncharacterized protein with HEPN domain
MGKWGLARILLFEKVPVPIFVRNILIHDYFGVSTPVVWDIVQNKLPSLREACQRALRENPFGD